MIEAIRQLLRPKPIDGRPAVPPGQRVYAIGDIHGRLDLFLGIVSAIERDDAARGDAETTIILLGDLIDRGADSASVVAAARALQQGRSARIVAGNHEEMFLRCFDDNEAIVHFLRYGGRETLLSYGVDPSVLHLGSPSEAQASMHELVPKEDLVFLRGLEDSIVIGGYLFVHAGIRPGIPIAQQELNDLRWIREPFLGHAGEHGHVVVHGHTITAEPEVRHNRIGIDTGAFRSGRLTALGLEGTERWIIEACDSQGTIASTVRPA